MGWTGGVVGWSHDSSVAGLACRVAVMTRGCFISHLISCPTHPVAPTRGSGSAATRSVARPLHRCTRGSGLLAACYHEVAVCDFGGSESRMQVRRNASLLTVSSQGGCKVTTPLSFPPHLMTFALVTETRELAGARVGDVPHERRIDKGGGAVAQV